MKDNIVFAALLGPLIAKSSFAQNNLPAARYGALPARQLRWHETETYSLIQTSG